MVRKETLAKMVQDKQDKLLIRMCSIMVDQPISKVKLAKEINISFATLRKFLNGELVGFEQLHKIEKYIKESESIK